MVCGGASTVGVAFFCSGKLTGGFFAVMYGGGGLASGNGVAGGGCGALLVAVEDVAGAIGTTTGAI